MTPELSKLLCIRILATYLPIASFGSCNDCRRRPLLGWVGKTGGFGTAERQLTGSYFHYIDGQSGQKAKGQGAQSSCGWANGCDRSVWAFDYTKCCEIDGYAGNNKCEDGGPQTSTSVQYLEQGQSVVPYGWDFSDCGYRTSLRPVLVEYACDDSCGSEFANNGVCNERMWSMEPFASLSVASDAYSCAFGTDCGDCGAKNSPVMTTPDHMGGAFDTCVDYITGVPQYRNGLCQDGGHGAQQKITDAQGQVSWVGAFICEYGTELVCLSSNQLHGAFTSCADYRVVASQFHRLCRGLAKPAKRPAGVQVHCTARRVRAAKWPRVQELR